MGFVTFTFGDYSENTTRIKLYTPELDDTNINQYTTDTITNALGDMRLALNPLILGTHLKRQVTATVIADPEVYPTDVNAQKERKARVVFQDNVTLKKYSFEIGTFSMVGVVDNSDDIDLTQSDWANFVSEFESRWRSELGNNVTVISAEHVGRSG